MLNFLEFKSPIFLPIFSIPKKDMRVDILQIKDLQLQYNIIKEKLLL